MDKDKKKEYESIEIEVLKFEDVIDTNSFGETTSVNGDLPTNIFGDNNE